MDDTQWKSKVRDWCNPCVGLMDIFLLYDNAQAHKSCVVVDFLSREKDNFLTHPPYSPDFPRIKNDLSGRGYISRSALGGTVQQYQGQTTMELFSNGFLRLQKYISVKGEYFEGLEYIIVGQYFSRIHFINEVILLFQHPCV